MDPALDLQVEEAEASEPVAVLVKLRDPRAPPPWMTVVSQFGDVVTGRVPAGLVAATRAHRSVVSVKGGRHVTVEPALDPDPETPQPPAAPSRARARRPATGRGVVVAVLDWGCDFAHPNFRRPDGSTRLDALWDQGAPFDPAHPNPWGYGVVHRREAIDRALRAPDPYAALGYHPGRSDDGAGTHGTHVLDIAAGGGAVGQPGVAPEADLLFVHLSTGDTTALGNLGDSVRLLEALDFVRATAGPRPWVVNMSLGRHGGPHDGTTLAEQAMDAILAATPGAAIVMSTGNYRAARTHAGGRLRPGRARTLRWLVDPADVTPNELEIWYSGRDVLAVTVRGPDGQPSVTAPLGAKADIVAGGEAVGRVYNRLHDPTNGDNHVDIFLRPGAPGGEWQVELAGADVVDGRFEAWIERDAGNPRNQSRFHEDDATPGSTVGTVCTGHRTVAVGAYEEGSPDGRLAPFSSCGPTRDDRWKPDLVAPGVGVMAARSSPPGSRAFAGGLTRRSGTSMAAPHVTGTVALMFQAAPRKLGIAETRALLLGAARAAPAHLGPCAGSGYLDVDAAVEAAATRPGRRAPRPTPADAIPVRDIMAIAARESSGHRPRLYVPAGAHAESRSAGGRTAMESVPAVPVAGSAALLLERGAAATEDDPNVVDEVAAVVPFAADERARLGPLLEPRQRAAAAHWNAARHPAVSGMDLDSLRERLERNYVDLGAVRRALTAAGQSEGADAGDLLAEAVHQFQRKTYAEPRRWDGKAGESTLDALGFLHQRGTRTVARSNAAASRHLAALAGAGRFRGAEAELSGLDPTRWFEGMVNAPFLGRTFTNGIHAVFLRRLRRAEGHLLSLPAYAGFTPRRLGEALGIDEDHKGARPSSAGASMHTLGLAADVRYLGNPYVAGGHEKPNANRAFTAATGRAALLVSGERADVTAASLHALRTRPTREIVEALARRDADLRAYLGFASDLPALQRSLEARRRDGTPGVFASPVEPRADAAARWQRAAQRDLAALSLDGSNFTARRDPRNGFFNLHLDLVVALRDHACLAWGAVDFGPRSSGDIMHFDCRPIGVGRVVNRGWVVPEGEHPCAGDSGTGEAAAEGLAAGETEPEAPEQALVAFPSGESLRVTSGPEAENEEFWDSNGSGNPLLDTGGAERDKSMARNFRVREYAPDDRARIDPRLISCLQRIRDRVGRPVTITSGYRSFFRNRSANGARRSQHMSGRAADIRVAGMTGLELGKAALEACPCELSIGLGTTFVHVDVRPKARRGDFVTWKYDGVTEADHDALRRHHGAVCQGAGPSPLPPSPPPPATRPDPEINLPRAVERNRHHAGKQGWAPRMAEILRLLGFRGIPPVEEEFALAVARWQRDQGGLDVDGILGPGSWARMRSVLDAGGTGTATPPTTITLPPVVIAGTPPPAPTTITLPPLVITATPPGATPQATSDDGVRFVARHEGFRGSLYNDVAGHCTIGYGHLVHRGACDGSEPAEFRGGIDRARGQGLLRADVAGAERTVRDAVTVPLTHNQFDALVSFTFNVGAANFRGSTLLRRLNAGEYAAVPDELNRWVFAGGQRQRGLENRRRDEGALFRDATYGEAVSESEAIGLVEVTPAERVQNLNRWYMLSMGWKDHRAAIEGALGAGSFDANGHLDPARLTPWQAARRPLDADGILGPKSWAQMASELGVPPGPPVVMGPLPDPFDVAKAVDRNRHWAADKTTLWAREFGDVLDIVFLGADPPDEIEFARAVFRWQGLVGGLATDGILGPKSWARLRAERARRRGRPGTPPPVGTSFTLLVKDPAGAPRRGFPLLLFEPGVGHAARDVMTDERGQLVLPHVAEGTYEVTSTTHELEDPVLGAAGNEVVSVVDAPVQGGLPDPYTHVALVPNTTHIVVARQLVFLVCPMCGVTFKTTEAAGSGSHRCPHDGFDLGLLQPEALANPSTFTRPPVTRQDPKRTPTGLRCRGTVTFSTTHTPSVTAFRDESRFVDPAGGDYRLWGRLGSGVEKTVDIVGRATWGARPPVTTGSLEYEFHATAAGASPPYTTTVPSNETAPLRDVLRWMTIHHTADPPIRSPETVRDIQHHQQTSSKSPHCPCADVTYHYVVDADGTIYEGRALGIKGSHVPKFNGGNVGIVLAGEFHKERPTVAALDSLERLVDVLAMRFEIRSVWGHNERNKQSTGKHTVCPGPNLVSFVDGTLRPRYPGPPP